MSLQKGNESWLKRGRQRIAVAQVLRKPLTTSEICRAAHAINPRVQLRDVWFIMEQLKERGLAVCLNPKHVTGKLYALTDRGRRVVRRCYGVRTQRIPENVDWRCYAQVARAKVRRVVLLELANSPGGTPLTATQVRKRGNAHHPLGLNPAIRALKDLEAMGVVRTNKGYEHLAPRTYKLTPKGKRVSDQLLL